MRKPTLSESHPFSFRLADRLDPVDLDEAARSFESALEDLYTDTMIDALAETAQPGVPDEIRDSGWDCDGFRVSLARGEDETDEQAETREAREIQLARAFEAAVREHAEALAVAALAPFGLVRTLAELAEAAGLDEGSIKAWVDNDLLDADACASIWKALHERTNTESDASTEDVLASLGASERLAHTIDHDDPQSGRDECQFCEDVAHKADIQDRLDDLDDEDLDDETKVARHLADLAQIDEIADILAAERERRSL